jgi:hypothetical protein
VYVRRRQLYAFTESHYQQIINYTMRIWPKLCALWHSQYSTVGIKGAVEGEGWVSGSKLDQDIGYSRIRTIELL